MPLKGTLRFPTLHFLFAVHREIQTSPPLYTHTSDMLCCHRPRRLANCPQTETRNPNKPYSFNVIFSTRQDRKKLKTKCTSSKIMKCFIPVPRKLSLFLTEIKHYHHLLSVFFLSSLQPSTSFTLSSLNASVFHPWSASSCSLLPTKLQAYSHCHPEH